MATQPAAKKPVPTTARKTAAGAAHDYRMKGAFAELAAEHELSKKQAEALLAGMIEMVTGHKKGDRSGLGGHPATGETIRIAASKKVAFRPAKELKEAV